MKHALVALAFMVGLAACAPRVAVDKANVDFSKYRTFAWMNSDVKGTTKNPLYYNQLATEQVENTVAAELGKKGLKQVTRRPDLLLGYHFFVEEKTRTVANNTGGPYGFYGPYAGWGRWGYGGWGPGWWGNSFGNTQYTQEKYEAGTVVVDMVDARTKRLVWRGAVQNAIGNPTKISENLAKQVERIVEQFPQVRG